MVIPIRASEQLGNSSKPAFSGSLFRLGLLLSLSDGGL